MSIAARSPIPLAACAALLVISAACVAAGQQPPLCGAEPVVEELTLQSRDAALRAVLHVPAGPGRHPAVVLVHGSGRATAEDMSRWSARRFLDRGVAVLAYDKRGVGKSTGTYSGVGAANSDEMFSVLAGDALVAIEALKGRPDIHASQLGLFGNSQGGWIAPLAASRSRDVKFVVSLSGPAVTVGEENAYSRLAGADPGSLQGLSDTEIATQFAAFKGPHGYDPIPVLRGLATPSFWIIGERDRSIPVRETLDNLTRLARESARPITIKAIPGADHGMRDAATGRPVDYWPDLFAWLAPIVTLRPCRTGL
jgi:dienelactone hydrolase